MDLSGIEEDYYRTKARNWTTDADALLDCFLTAIASRVAVSPSFYKMI